jgi:hypothetical protein
VPDQSLLRGALACACTFLVLASSSAHAAPKKALRAFASEQEISDLFKRWAEAAPPRREPRMAASTYDAAAPAPSVGMSAAAPAAKVSAEQDAESITNVQHAGVDEGSIVKRHGEHLVILRRGRLFTVRIGGDALAPVSVADAYGNGIDPRAAWYDEMLIAGDTIAVIGYSYARGGTEVGLFEISRSGRLRYKATYHLRSNDYYSSRNYASRLIGTKLVFYSPMHLNPWGGEPWSAFPALRRWRPGVTDADFKRIAPATRIYRTDEPLDPYQGVALHTVTACDLTAPELECESSAVMGPPGRVFYVSGGSVYVWVAQGQWRRSAAASGSAVFRIPLDGSTPTALKTKDSPIDQFSFLESDDGHLNVLVRPDGRGEGMWAAEGRAGDFALLRVPLDSFSDGTQSAPAAAYRRLPRANGHAVQNRYIGGYLLYGTGAGWDAPQRTLHARVHAVRYASRSAVQSIPLAHGVDRIEALGANAVVIGSDGRDLHFTSLRLGASAAAQERYTRKDAAQGETRSHGFYYKPDASDAGYVGLPIVGGFEAASHQLGHTSAAVLFLRNEALRLSELGALDAQAATQADDGCRASCVDWYGNSRPIFANDRIFALMGYEIVEGRVSRGRIAEIQRVSFLPVNVSLAR